MIKIILLYVGTNTLREGLSYDTIDIIYKRVQWIQDIDYCINVWRINICS